MYRIIGRIEFGDEEFVLDQTNLISIDLECYDRDDLSKPSWGIIANGGSVEFVDYDGTIAGYAEDNVFKNNYPIRFYLIDDDGNETIVATKFTKHWEYDNDNYHVQVELGDVELEGFQDVQIEAIPLSLENKNINMVSFLEQIFLYYNFAYMPKRDTTCKNHLTSMKAKYFYTTEDCSLWTLLNDFCKAVNTHVFVDRNGDIVMRYNGGN